MTPRYPWKRILIPTDFSTAAEWVFDDAIEAASRSGAEILILHVRMTQKSNPDELRFPADPSLYDYVERHELDLLQQHVARTDPNVGTRLLVRTSPDPASQILATAREEDADLVVMATHARHHIAHLIIGSTTLSLLSRCTLPILTLRYGIRKPLSMQRILLAVDPDRPSSEPAAMAAAIAADQRSSVLLATIAPEEKLASARAAVETLRSQFPGECEVRAIEGRNPGREIVRIAETDNIELTVISPGCKPGGTISEIAQTILRRIGTPVLVVPG